MNAYVYFGLDWVEVRSLTTAGEVSFVGTAVAGTDGDGREGEGDDAGDMHDGRSGR